MRCLLPGHYLSWRNLTHPTTPPAHAYRCGSAHQPVDGRRESGSPSGVVTHLDGDPVGGEARDEYESLTLTDDEGLRRGALGGALHVLDELQPLPLDQAETDAPRRQGIPDPRSAVRGIEGKRDPPLIPPGGYKKVAMNTLNGKEKKG